MDILNAGSGHALTTLIPYGPIEDKKVRAARRTNYRPTAEGQRVAAEFARLTDQEAQPNRP